MAHHLVVDECAAKGLALLRPAQGFVITALGKTQRHRRHRQALAVEVGQDDLEARALLAYEVAGGHTHPIKAQMCRVRTQPAHLLQRAARETHGIAGHHQHGDAHGAFVLEISTHRHREPVRAHALLVQLGILVEVELLLLHDRQESKQRAARVLAEHGVYFLERLQRAQGDVELAAQLDKASDNIASIYAAKAGGSVTDWRDAMLAETWYSADEAVSAGLADLVLDAPVASEGPSNRWDLSMYRNRGRGDAPAPVLPSPAERDRLSGDEAARALERGKVDVFITDSTLAWHLAGTHAESLVVVPYLLSEEVLAWGVRRGNDELLAAANEFLAAAAQAPKVTGLVQVWYTQMADSNLRLNGAAPGGYYNLRSEFKENGLNLRRAELKFSGDAFRLSRWRTPETGGFLLDEPEVQATLLLFAYREKCF